MAAKQEIIVIGCGVSALSSGIRLLERYRVRIITQQMPPHTTSDIAAAFWKPFRIIHQDRVREWSKVSLDQFYQQSEIAGSGVSIATLIHLVGPEAGAPWWMDLVRLHRRASAEELPVGFVKGYAVEVAKIETPIYMPYLVSRFKELGGTIEIVDQPLKLADLYGKHRVIVNCTGLGAGNFCSDQKVFPIRGQVIRIAVKEIKCLIDYDIEPTYVVPRTNDCILGGTAQENDWNVAPNTKDAESILERCQKLSPALSEVKILDHKVGLRPGRREVRLELETITGTCTVVHNYGHGRAGFTLSWGCAQEVFELVTSIIDR